MKSYNDDLIELEYGGIFVYNNIITLELFDINEENEQYIEMVIGDVEATNIMHVAENDIFDFLPNDTFDLFIDALNKFDIKISGVIISGEEYGKWTAEIELINLETNAKTYIESRPTDAVILSIKEKIPIMINKEFLEKQYKKELNKDSKEDITTSVKSLEEMSIDNLEKMLNSYVEEEKYEDAAKIKKRIDKIKGGK